MHFFPKTFPWLSRNHLRDHRCYACQNQQQEIGNQLKTSLIPSSMINRTDAQTHLIGIATYLTLKLMGFWRSELYA